MRNPLRLPKRPVITRRALPKLTISEQTETVNLEWLAVVVRCGREVHSWAKRLGIPFIVYEKNNPKAHYSVPVNKGQEASGYLKFCVDHYDKLPERIVFLHDHEFSGHHKESIVDRVREQIILSPRMCNLNYKRLGLIKRNIDWPGIQEWYNEYLEPYLGPHEQYGDWTFGKCGMAQFVVHRDIIRKMPLVFYQNIYKWITTTSLSNYYSSRRMEFTWELYWK